jgi:hypothetical protein
MGYDWVTVGLQFLRWFFGMHEGLSHHRRKRRPLSRGRQNGLAHTTIAFHRCAEAERFVRPTRAALCVTGTIGPESLANLGRSPSCTMAGHQCTDSPAADGTAVQVLGEAINSGYGVLPAQSPAQGPRQTRAASRGRILHASCPRRRAPLKSFLAPAIRQYLGCFVHLWRAGRVAVRGVLGPLRIGARLALPRNCGGANRAVALPRSRHSRLGAHGRPQTRPRPPAAPGSGPRRVPRRPC